MAKPGGQTPIARACRQCGGVHIGHEHNKPVRRKPVKLTSR